MYNKISFSAIAAMAALSMVSLTACGDENSDIAGATEESGLSSSSTPSVEPESSSSGESALSSSSAPLIELSSSSGESALSSSSTPSVEQESSSSSESELSSSSAPSIESSSMVESSSSSSEKKIKCYETDGKIGDVCADAYLSYVSQGVHGGITAGPVIIDCYIYTEKGWNKMGGTLEDWWKKMGYSRDSLEGDLLEGDLHICKEYAAVYEKCAIEEPITGDTCSYEVDGEVYYYFFMYDVWSKNGHDAWLKNGDDEF